MRTIGATFFALAAYIIVEAIRHLVTHSPPETSTLGIAVAAAALVVMPLLAVGKKRTGMALGNRTLIADAAETAFCASLSAALLVGLGVNAVAGWWWADPVAGLVIAAFAVREGIEAWGGDDS